MLGILVVDKPSEMSSHDVVAICRKKFNTRRVGHSGTLDPLATGVLVLAIGPATRFLQFLDLEPKTYEFDVQFGVSTNTQDAEGEVSAERPVPHDLADQIERHLPTFLGGIKQIPPMFSAVKQKGKPLYILARQGIEVERAERSVFIESFEVTGVTENLVSMRCVCSGGTYVRTLAHDLGEAIGCGGHLRSLRRTQVGRFLIESAAKLDEAGAPDVIPLKEALSNHEFVVLPSDIEMRIREGQRIPISPVPKNQFVVLVDEQGAVIGMARVNKGSLHPECIIPQEVALGQV